MTRVAIATCAAMPELQRGDELVASALRERGAEVSTWVWEHPVPQVDAVLFRSCWDYHDKVEHFREVLSALDRADISTFNTTAVVRENLDKRYLNRFEGTAVKIPKTRFVENEEELRGPDLRRLFSESTLVVKPAISCGGHDTFKVSPGEERGLERTLDVMKRRGVVMVQEFLHDISSGELSFVFIAGRFSHAVIKRAAPGEFRIHIEYGGTVEDYAPAAHLLAQAQAAYDLVAQGAYYARVDGVVRGQQLVVMESELIEPELFFPHRPQAADELADALISVLSDHSS